ncbi:hypothetical protein HY003_02380 [Candidatus Saccharibacteria bacterium]|nr:hypothetical protein [Candidatus Saccharibacteria bacterium]MBI3338123.1 hypothetical protein [Candidatus Saccharibacteria bacterium]
MTATNHALTGSLIGLSVINPFVALPLAFLSHFVLDALPHFGNKTLEMNSSEFTLMLMVDAWFCLLLVCVLLILQPSGWLVVIASAFLATLPDFMWFPKYWRAIKHRPKRAYKNMFVRFHANIQWSETPKGAYVEIAWALIVATLLMRGLGQAI